MLQIKFWRCHFAHSKPIFASILDNFHQEMHNFFLGRAFIYVRSHLCYFLIFLLPPCVHSAMDIWRQKILHYLSIYSGTSNMQFFYPYSTWWSICTMLQILQKCEVKASFCWKTILPLANSISQKTSFLASLAVLNLDVRTF